ncbi:MAG: hypothetical protein U5L96_19305 [Owenweeksia sp.]|nr:hypothetical protein [Owenweeksia sp.]
MNNKTVLGVLNWGLGHATRSGRIIEALQDAGYQPVLASDGAALQYLKQRFPQLPVAKLPSYGIRYSKRLSSLVAVLLQAPKILRASQAEKVVCVIWLGNIGRPASFQITAWGLATQEFLRPT